MAREVRDAFTFICSSDGAAEFVENTDDEEWLAVQEARLVARKQLS